MSNFKEKTTKNYDTIMRIKRHTNQSFFVEIGNYSVNFMDELGGKKGQTKLITEERTYKVFAASKMIIRDAKNSPKWNEIKDISFESDNFGIVGGIENCFIANAINIDIKNAYPTTLLNAGLITLPTFNYINSLSKLDRLAAIGMCAKSSVVFEYCKGILMDYKTVESEYKNIFFFALSTVQDVMVNISQMAMGYYIYHWVDGIYLKPGIPPDLINDINTELCKMGYNTTFEQLSDFVCTRNCQDIKMAFTTSVGRKKVFRFYDNNFDKNFTIIKKSLIKKVINQKIKHEITKSN